MNACNKLYASPINSYWYITLKTRNSSMVGQEKKSRKSIGCLIWKAWMCQSIQYILRYPTENFDKLVVQDEKSWEGSRVGFSSGEHECWMTANVSLQYLSLFNLKCLVKHVQKSTVSKSPVFSGISSGIRVWHGHCGIGASKLDEWDTLSLTKKLSYQFILSIRSRTMATVY